jgi:multiple sugar transport system substrate-binding protein
MPTEIEFSILSDEGPLIQPFLEEFEAETAIRVHLRYMDWDAAWNQLVRAAIYNDGPDISEIGTTWTGDLIGMNALRSFNANEINSMGRSQVFVPAAWLNAMPTGDKSWAVPWAAGSRLIYYRPRLFAQAEIDPQTVFTSPETLINAARCLVDHGSRVPLAVSTGGTHATLHNLASWLWARGGNFVRPDGRAMALLEPKALLGMREYFAFGRFLTHGISLLGASAPEEFFQMNQDTAMTISGTWLVSQLGDEKFGPGKEFFAAQMPGPSFVGGSNLVIWKYSRHAEAAVQFARYMTSASVQARLVRLVGLLPVRVDVLGTPPFSNEPYWQMAAQGLLSGRTFPSIRLWGVIEDRLAAGMDAVWKDVLAHPDVDPQDALVRFLTPLCQRLDLMMQDK